MIWVVASIAICVAIVGTWVTLRQQSQLDSLFTITRQLSEVLGKLTQSIDENTQVQEGNQEQIANLSQQYEKVLDALRGWDQGSTG